MNLEVIQNGRVLTTYSHNGQLFAEAPESGEYELRLTNTSLNRRMAVISVDGINVIDGKEAGVEGSGYVLNPWQSTTIKGFLRGSTECARFTFSASQGSYAAQTGRGTKNTGIIGVAVFDEKVKPVVFQPPVIIKEVHHYHDRPVTRGGWSQTTTLGGHYSAGNGGVGSLGDGFSSGIGNLGDGFSTNGIGDFDLKREFDTVCSAAPESAPTKSAESRSRRISHSTTPDLGTAYGRAESFYTSTTTFERATSAPTSVITLRYGVRAKLIEWGVPVHTESTAFPSAFPASSGFAAPPPGWVR